MKHHTLALAMLFAAFTTSSSQCSVETTEAPFGSWRSPIKTQMLVQGAVRFGDMSLNGDTLYWVELRPEEQGRCVIVRRTPDGEIGDVLPPPFSARTLLHEYGGGALIAIGSELFFTNYADQQIWRMQPGHTPRQLTKHKHLRFADYTHDAKFNRLIAVCEEHDEDSAEPINNIVAVSLDDGKVTTLAKGADFYSNPRVSPDSSQLAWLSWNHPNMPWDGTKLFVASIRSDASLGSARQVAGGNEESIFQPSWSPDGTLYFVSDRTNWWNLYGEHDGQVAAKLPLDAEFGVPQWIFGMTTYGFDATGHIIARYSSGGTWRLTQIEPQTGRQRPFELPFTTISSVHVSGHHAFITAGSATHMESLVEIDLSSGNAREIRRSSPIEPDPSYTSIPEAIEFPTDGDKTSHAFYYPPTNRDFCGPRGEAPPLLVLIHGGPTSATSSQFRLTTQYWTSRGIAVCDVNYGGSTGYGREYRNRLRGSWGVVDVRDAVNAAKYLVDQGKADRTKLMIRGGSAGGYTTLACLAFSDVFRCGASHYGIADLALMVRDTHKFESRYLDRLVGTLPQDEAIYRERSPIFHLDNFTEPVILLHGLEDKVVPPNQAEAILDSLKGRGVPVAYVPFPGEQHGFRKAENIMRAHEAELYFYSRIFGFPLADEIEPVEIYNLPAR